MNFIYYIKTDKNIRLFDMIVIKESYILVI